MEKLEIEYGSEIEFQRCHRLGLKPENGKANREIIVRFLWFQDREDVWNKKRKLKGTNIVVKEDFPTEIELKRSKMYPKMLKRQKCNLKVDKLVLDGKKYTVHTLYKLPPNFQPANLAMFTTDESILFYGKDCFLSNFHPARFDIQNSELRIHLFDKLNVS